MPPPSSTDPSRTSDDGEGEGKPNHKRLKPNDEDGSEPSPMEVESNGNSVVSEERQTMKEEKPQEEKKSESGGEDEYFVGVDVGSYSIRAGVVSVNGKVLSSFVQEIPVHTPEPKYYEQSSDDVWESVCRCVKEAVSLSNVPPSLIKSIGFDATCSL